MGYMKELDIRIRNGGDDAVAAVQRIGEDWRLQLDAAAGEVERLRGDLEVARLQAKAAAGELEKLRSRLRLADAAIRSESPTLTDAERVAIHRAEARVRTAYVPDDETAATLRGLLDRTQDGGT
jgi:hypothetical protein